MDHKQKLARRRETKRAYVASMTPERLREYRAAQKVRNTKYYQKTGRSKHFEKAYGITQADFYRLWAEQNGNCALCKKAMNLNDHLPDSGVVEHDHNPPYKIRGIVHLWCNMLLKDAREDIVVLQSAIDYLREHGSD